MEIQMKFQKKFSLDQKYNQWSVLIYRVDVIPGCERLRMIVGWRLGCGCANVEVELPQTGVRVEWRLKTQGPEELPTKLSFKLIHVFH